MSHTIYSMAYPTYVYQTEEAWTERQRTIRVNTEKDMRRKYPWHELKVDEFFSVPNTPRNRANLASAAYAQNERNQGVGKEFVTFSDERFPTEYFAQRMK